MGGFSLFTVCFSAGQVSLATIELGSTVKSQRKFTVVIERDEDGYYVAAVPTLRGCHTQAKTLDTLMKRIREAVELCLDAEETRDAQLELVGVQQICI